MASPMPRLAPVISAIRSFRRIGGVSLFLAVFGEQGELLGTARRAGELVGQADRIVAGEAGIAEGRLGRIARRSEEHTSELQSLMRISYAVFCLKKKKNHRTQIEN